MRDERNTAFASDAYARLTHKVGVFEVTVGSGTTKLPSGLMEAYYSSIPVLGVISEITLGWQHLVDRGAALQVMEQERLISHFCKWTTTVTTPEQLPMMLATALRRSVAGRLGLIALVFPHNVFDAR